MLFQQYNWKYNVYITIGQIALVAGILMNLFLPNIWTSDFGTGFCYGLSGVLIGLSIVMNITGLIKYRKFRNSSELTAK